MHMDNEKTLEWLHKLSDGVRNHNHAAECEAELAMKAGKMYRALSIIAGYLDECTPNEHADAAAAMRDFAKEALTE